jgi:hypothetical protein
LWHLDCSCNRDKVNMAVGRPACRSAGALVVMVFASPSGQFHHDKTIRVHLSGLSTVRTNYRYPKLCTVYRVPIAIGRQETRHLDPSLALWAGSDGTSLNRQAVSGHCNGRHCQNEQFDKEEYFLNKNLYLLFINNYLLYLRHNLNS